MRTTLYRFFDADDRLLYVGITASAATRIAQHATKEWFPKVARASFEHYPSRADATVAEVAAIKTEAPLYNLRHVDAPGEYGVAEAAEYIRVDAPTLKRWAEAGAVPCKRRQDGGYRFRKVDLDRFLQSLRAREAVA